MPYFIFLVYLLFKLLFCVAATGLIVYFFFKCPLNIKLAVLGVMALLLIVFLGKYYVAGLNTKEYTDGYVQNIYFGSDCSKLTQDQCLQDDHCACNPSKMYNYCTSCRSATEAEYQTFQAEQHLCETTGGAWEKAVINYCDCKGDPNRSAADGFKEMDKTIGCVYAKDFCENNHGQWIPYATSCDQLPTLKGKYKYCGEDNQFFWNGCLCPDGSVTAGVGDPCVQEAL